MASMRIATRLWTWSVRLAKPLRIYGRPSMCEDI